MRRLQLRFDFDSTAVRLLIKGHSDVTRCWPMTRWQQSCWPIYLFRPHSVQQQYDRNVGRWMVVARSNCCRTTVESTSNHGFNHRLKLHFFHHYYFLFLFNRPLFWRSLQVKAVPVKVSQRTFLELLVVREFLQTGFLFCHSTNIVKSLKPSNFTFNSCNSWSGYHR